MTKSKIRVAGNAAKMLNRLFMLPQLNRSMVEMARREAGGYVQPKTYRGHPGSKKGAHHVVNPPGTKLARQANDQSLTKRS